MLDFASLFVVQALATLQVNGDGPVRLGLPLPGRALERGLHLEGSGRAMQWRPLQTGADPETGKVWIELAVTGGKGRVVVQAGGQGPTLGHQGEAFGHEVEETVIAGATRRRERWTWVTGEVDERTVTRFTAPSEWAGETFAAEEAFTEVSAGFTRRWQEVAVNRSFWEQAQLLPKNLGLAAFVRKRLAVVGAALAELPGVRGAGDYGRSGGVVTNLEFDTALGFLRLWLSEGRPEWLTRAQRCARHTLERDLDVRSGLPFPHGLEHRMGTPEPGHAWLQGMLLVGCITADDELICCARNMAQAIASQPPMGEGRSERAREFAWPLLELEAFLRFEPDPGCAKGADRLAAAIAGRFDGRARTFRFGEGEVEKGVYFERAWLTQGLVIPALKAHLLRRADAKLDQQVQTVVQGFLDQLGNGKAGIPTYWRCAGTNTFAEHRAHDDARAYLALEGLSGDELRRLLHKEGMLHALGEVPALADPDLPTTFSQLARCSWIYR